MWFWCVIRNVSFLLREHDVDGAYSSYSLWDHFHMFVNALNTISIFIASQFYIISKFILYGFICDGDLVFDLFVPRLLLHRF